jgi:beta-fructofuranosidase
LLRLRVFLDRSVLEVFANERVCIGERIYPSRPDSLGLALFAEGGSAELRGLDVWEMGTIWGEADSVG